MPRLLVLSVLTLAASLAGCSKPAAAELAQPSAAPQGDPASPVIIELFQSQGCSSCPPALAVLDKLADRRDVIALNFAVTYWDRLGWKDRFAKPAFTARQWDYARAAGRPNVQTPQLIVEGRKAVLGSRIGEAEAAIEAAAHPAGPAITITRDSVILGGGPRLRATVWLATYDPRKVAVPIRAGENGGRTLVHRNIVTGLDTLGPWTGDAVRFALPSARPGLARAVFVQQDRAGPILAARKI